jgi:DNA repair protein RadC
LHEGHRKRLYQKLCEGTNLYEHEILEILLYNAYPRIDTNPIAHKLLERFASIGAILSASPDELKEIDGVGEQVALYLACVGKCLELKNSNLSFGTVNNYGEMRNFAFARLQGADAEKLEMYLLDKKGKIMRVCTYSQGSADRVTVSPTEVGKVLSLYHPYGLFVAHNHVLCGATPSRADNNFTKEIQLICSIHNIEFYDHIIFGSNGEFYSYFNEGKITEIKQEFSVGALLRNENKV